MPNVTAPSLTFPTASFPNPSTASSGIAGELLLSALSSSFSNLVKAGKVHTAYATTTGCVIYTTAAGTGGPIIFNPSASGVDCHILAVSLLTVVAAAAAGGVGFTGNTGGNSANTAIDASGNALAGGPNSAVNVYRVATPTNAGNFFMPLAQVDTGALTVSNMTPAWIRVDGAFVIPPGNWGGLAASATLTTAQLSMGLIWAELPH